DPRPRAEGEVFERALIGGLRSLAQAVDGSLEAGLGIGVAARMKVDADEEVVGEGMAKGRRPFLLLAGEEGRGQVGGRLYRVVVYAEAPVDDRQLLRDGDVVGRDAALEARRAEFGATQVAEASALTECVVCRI